MRRDSRFQSSPSRTDRGEKIERNCDHCGKEYVDIYSSDTTHSKYCSQCAEKYEEIERTAQAMNLDDKQLADLYTLVEGTRFSLWIDIHPHRAYIFDTETIQWEISEWGDMRE